MSVSQQHCLLEAMRIFVVKSDALIVKTIGLKKFFQVCIYNLKAVTKNLTAAMLMDLEPGNLDSNPDSAS